MRLCSVHKYHQVEIEVKNVSCGKFQQLYISLERIQVLLNFYNNSLLHFVFKHSKSLHKNNFLEIRFLHFSKNYHHSYCYYYFHCYQYKYSAPPFSIYRHNSLKSQFPRYILTLLSATRTSRLPTFAIYFSGQRVIVFTSA